MQAYFEQEGVAESVSTNVTTVAAPDAKQEDPKQTIGEQEVVNASRAWKTIISQITHITVPQRTLDMGSPSAEWSVYIGKQDVFQASAWSRKNNADA